MQFLTCAIKDAPVVSCNTQMEAINDTRELFGKWHNQSPPMDNISQGTTPAPRHAPPRVTQQPHITPEPTRKTCATLVTKTAVSRPTPYPRVASILDVTPPRVTSAHTTLVPKSVIHNTIYHHTHSRKPLANIIKHATSVRQKVPMEIINKWSIPVLDK